MVAYFLSDIHLGAPYFQDSREAERRVVAFLDSISVDAEAVYLLGDILDYWYEYRYVVPRGFVRFFGKLAEMADRGVRIVWFIGNHDIWIDDYIPSELGVEVVDGSRVETIDGHKFYMTHGDGVPPMKRSFRFLRGLFRNKVCQRLFSGIHPRWTVPFAYRWSRHSRATARMTETGSQAMTAKYADFAATYAQGHPDIEYFLFGHLHVVLDQNVTETSRMLILGDWISHFTFARWDGCALTLQRYQSPLREL